MAAKSTKIEHREPAEIDEVGRHFFGHGLYLQVKGPNAKSWILRYTLHGVARWLGLGSASVLDVARAKAEATSKREKIKVDKVDPVGERKERAHLDRVAKSRAVSFRKAVDEFLAQHQAGWRNEKHGKQWRSTLETYAYPKIAARGVGDITARDVIDILRPIWNEKRETARRLAGRIEAVLDYAADPNDESWRNPAAMTAQLRKRLPRDDRRAKQITHHAALPYADVAAFWTALTGHAGVAARALQWTILTAARTGETIGMKPAEVNRRDRAWTIPPQRMKAGREHRVPLTDAALEIFDRVRRDYPESRFVFPGGSANGPLSNMGMLAVLGRMQRRDVTVHGFRSTFRDWSTEVGGFPRELAEAALAHVLGDKTEQAYARGTLFERRREMMEAWSAYCAAGDGNVVRMLTG